MKEDFRFRLVYLPMLLATLFWAAGHPLGRIILQKVHPFQLGSVTLSVGFISVLAYLALTGKAPLLFRLSARDTVTSLALGAVGFAVYQVLTFSALSRIPASMNAILVSTNVILIAVLSAVFLREKIGWLRAAGILLAFIGVMLVTLNRGFSIGASVDLVGCSLSLLAALSFAQIGRAHV